MISLRQAEIQDLDLPLRRDLDVRWLEVAMDDAFLMGAFEAFRDLAADFQALFKGKSAVAQPPGQGLNLDKLKDKKPLAVGFLNSVNCCDIRMIERGYDSGLALKTRQPLRVSREDFGQGFAVGTAGAWPTGVSCVAQLLQNFVVSLLSDWHFGHLTVMPAPSIKLG
jgi:hypothetical protein